MSKYHYSTLMQHVATKECHKKLQNSERQCTAGIHGLPLGYHMPISYNTRIQFHDLFTSSQTNKC